MEVINLPFPLAFFIVWVLYVFVNYQVANNYANYRIALGFLVIMAFFLLKNERVAYLNKAIAIVSGIESIWCFLQWFGYIESESSFFKVTGSFANPNVIAMFLAMSMPAILYLLMKSRNVFKLIFIIEMVVLNIAILLLECRTAFIGSLLVCLVFFSLHFRVFNRFQKKHIILGVFIIAMLAIPIGNALYNYKKDSADGRKFVWHTSLNMIVEAPLTGYGVGLFSKAYNLTQAELIKENRLSENELKNASFVKMAYNDFLEQGIETGISGLLLFALMITSLLILTPSNTQNADAFNAAYAAIVACTVMMLINFVVSASAVMLLFCLYSGVLYNSSEHKYALKLHIRRVYSIPICIILVFLVTGYFSLHFNYAVAHIKFKKAQELIMAGNINEAEKKFSTLNKTLHSSESFLTSYGEIFFLKKDYEKSIEKFQAATRYSANPHIYDMLARCYFHLKNNEAAIYNMDLASRLYPKKMAYKYGLMRLLVVDNQLNKAEKEAENILNMIPVETNEITLKFQEEATRFLEQRKHNKTEI